jgi:hypothetical protein
MTDSPSLYWQIRHFIFMYIVEHERPPTTGETALALRLDREFVRDAYKWLGEKHAIFLDPGTLSVRMAHPFSAIPTPYRVHTNNHTYYANCAWDSFGILAALHQEGRIEATHVGGQDTITIDVADDQVYGHDEIIHFLLPFAQWYDDLVFT